MNNTIADVRDYLCKALAELADSDDDKEVMALKIERAKATSLVADKYIGAVKVEIDAIRLMDDTGKLPTAVTAPSIAPARPRLVG